MSELAILGFGRNDFTGTIPTQFGNLRNLGTIEPSIYDRRTENAALLNAHLFLRYFFLVYLGLERNEIGGTIPTELTALVNLGKSLNITKLGDELLVSCVCGF